MSTDQILSEMAATFCQRNNVYKDNYRVVGQIMPLLHPKGVQLLGADDHELYHLWSLIIVKITRFAASGLVHQDSIHDVAIYSAMIENILEERNKK
jgi:hypothetical protein